MDWKQIMKELTAEDEKIALIELEIARLQAQVVDMKKSRNRLVPFCRLPSEILGRIFFKTQVPKHDPFVEEIQDASVIHSVEILEHEASFHDFGYDDEWERAISLCSHVYQVCLNTPELWAYVNLAWPASKIQRCMSLSKSHDLTVLWIPNQYQTRFTLDVAVAGACFQRASAANILMKHSSQNEVGPMIGIIRQSAPRLSTLHFDSDDPFLLPEHDGITVVDLIELYPNLTELYLGRVNLYHSISQPLIHLSRLHLSTVYTDHHLHSVIDILEKTPNLTELVLELVHLVREQHQDISPEDSLTLAHLRKLRVEGSYAFVHLFFMALSPHVPKLQELHVHLEQARLLHDLGTMPSDIFRKVATLWTSITSLPLTPAKLKWFPSVGFMSCLEIQTSNNAMLTLGLQVLYRDEDVPLYRHYGLRIDTFEVHRLHARQLSTSWTILLNPIVDLLVPRLSRLKFHMCTSGVPGLEDWIHQRLLDGCTIDKIVFKQCDSIVKSSQHEAGTWSDYEKLKKSGLIGEVEWIHV
jgi:hypothetical protein